MARRRREGVLQRSAAERTSTDDNAATARAGLGLAELAMALGVYLDGLPQFDPVDVRPEHVGEDEFGVRRLPEHEVAQPLLPRGAPDHVGLGLLGHVQVA